MARGCTPPPLYTPYHITHVHTLSINGPSVCTPPCPQPPAQVHAGMHTLPCEQNEKYAYKHYLSQTSFADSKNQPVAWRHSFFCLEICSNFLEELSILQSGDSNSTQLQVRIINEMIVVVENTVLILPTHTVNFSFYCAA